jgi:hypothetical protein
VTERSCSHERLLLCHCHSHRPIPYNVVLTPARLWQATTTTTTTTTTVTIATTATSPVAAAAATTTTTTAKAMAVCHLPRRATTQVCKPAAAAAEVSTVRFLQNTATRFKQATTADSRLMSHCRPPLQSRLLQPATAGRTTLLSYPHLCSRTRRLGKIDEKRVRQKLRCHRKQHEEEEQKKQQQREKEKDRRRRRRHVCDMYDTWRASTRRASVPEHLAHERRAHPATAW